MSALKLVKISGYRGFNSVQEVHLAVPGAERREGGGLTVITGANNSGKSTIIEALRARTGRQLPTFSEGVRNKQADFVRFSFAFDDRDEVIESLSAGSSQARSDNLSANELVRIVPSRRGFQTYFARNEGDLHNYVLQTGLPPRRLSELAVFEMRLFQIEKSPEQFNELMGELLGYVPQWTLDQSSEGNHYVRLKNGQASHSSDGAGEGIVSLFSIVDALTSSQPGGIVAIDEPELSLHPAIIRRLARAIIRLSADRQIIVATHSPYFVDPTAIASGAALIRVVSEGGESVVHQLTDAGREALRKIHNPEKPNTKAPHTFGLDARELFFQDDKIVLTEGQDDVMLYPVVASQLPAQHVPGNLFGWGVGGADNMSHVCQMLQDLGYRRVAALLDNDQESKIAALSAKYPSYKFFIIPAKDVRDKKEEQARAAVYGLLEDGKILREEFHEEMERIFGEIKSGFHEETSATG